MRVLFIVNPAAGHGRGLARFHKVEKELLKAFPGSATALTSGPGEASTLVRRGLQEGFEVLVAVGGDGTLGEAVDGFLHAPSESRARAALATWPAGSGCDFARHLGLRAGRGSLKELLETGERRSVDAGAVEYQEGGARRRRYFLNVVTLGLGGAVARRVAASGKRWGGTLSYLAASVAEILSAKPYWLELSADGEPRAAGPWHLVAVANTSTTGGGMRIAPDASCVDGRLDFVAVAGLPRMELLRRMPSVYRGTHIKHPGVSHRLVSRLEVGSAETVYLNIDGEAAGTLPAVFEALPGAVPFICPSSGTGGL